MSTKKVTIRAQQTVLDQVLHEYMELFEQSMVKLKKKFIAHQNILSLIPSNPKITPDITELKKLITQISSQTEQIITNMDKQVAHSNQSIHPVGGMKHEEMVHHTQVAKEVGHHTQVANVQSNRPHSANVVGHHPDVANMVSNQPHLANVEVAKKVSQHPQSAKIVGHHTQVAKVVGQHPKLANEVGHHSQGANSAKHNLEGHQPHIETVARYAKDLHDGIEELSFTKFQQFAEYPKKAIQVQRLSLHLNSAGLTDNSMEHFVKCFYSFHSIESLKLDLGSNSLTHRGAKELAKCFTNLPNLIHLDFSIYNNKIGQEGISALIEAISNLPHLQDIQIDISCTSIGGRGFIYVAQSLFRMTRLRNLSIKAYDLGINDYSFKEALLALRQCQQLTSLAFDLRLYDKLLLQSSNPFDKDLLKILRRDMAIKNMNNYTIEV